MGEILYNRIDFKLDNLLMDIESGKLGLPDIQRPFVWKNIKVRELFDSMLLGYPIGYLMLWDSPDDGGKTKQIGTDSHAYKDAKQLIIIMEERLVSILNEMAKYLNMAQMKKLQEVLLNHLSEEALQRENMNYTL